MARLRVFEEAARDLLLVRAIESEDAEAVVLTADDRRHASAAALAASPLGERANMRERSSFLARRAGIALDRVIARYPALERVRSLTRWPSWLSWGLPLAALVIGLATNLIDGRQLNILAFPLVGMLAWNLAVYGLLLVSALRRAIAPAHEPRRHPFLRAIEWVVRPASARLASHPTLERAVARFTRDWASIAAKLTRHRASRTLHFSAMMLAIGIVTGMLARARYTTEYSAGWAGTWAGAESEVSAFLGVVLAPASALTGIALPTVERLRALRGATENAGEWLILWVVTALLFVIIPRLLLGLWDGVRAALLKRRLPIEEDFYVRSTLRNALGQPRTVRVIPYGFELTADGRERLGRLLTDVLGEKTKVRSDAPVPYGDEDTWLAREGDRLSDADQLILLFNLASTPEAENHGAFVSGVRRQLGRSAELMVLLDDSAFAQKFRAQQSAQRRLEERLQAWKAVLAPAGLEPVRVSLDFTDEVGAARALEQAMLQAPAAA